MNRPHKVPHAIVYFDDAIQASKSYNYFKTKDGFRSYKMKLPDICGKLMIQFDQRKYISRKAFSIHQLSTAQQQFFSDINDKFELKTMDNITSFGSWFRFDVTKLNAVQDFSSSNFHFVAEDINVFTKVYNNNEMSPLRLLSFDIEQYAVKFKDGTRRFPHACVFENFVSHIGLSLAVGKTVKQNICLCSSYNAFKADYTPQVKNLELKCYPSEICMLLDFWNLVQKMDCDILTGYNIIGYDISVLYLRTKMYYLCQQLEFSFLKRIHAVAKDKMAQFKKLMKNKQIPNYEKSKQVKLLFNHTSNDWKVYSNPPDVFYCLSAVPNFNYKVYSEFKRQAGVLDIEKAFYCSKIFGEKVSYKESLFESGAYGQIQLKYLDESNTGFGILCTWLHLKKTVKLKSYSLKNVMQYYLPESADTHKIDLPYETMFTYLEQNNEHHKALVADYCTRDAEAVIYLLHELESILDYRMFGSLTRCTLQLQFFGGQQKKIISKIYEVCSILDYYINNYLKESIDDDSKYQGAHVVIPIPKFYTNPVACLDFMSLYPSIMIEMNISFDTIIQTPNHKLNPNLQFNTINSDIGEAQFVKTFPGVLSIIESYLLTKRKAVKKAMKATKDASQKTILDKRQLSIKTLCNSVYGFCGVKAGYLPLRILAASITCRGREMIDITKAEVKRLGYNCVYGDTDSVMLEICNQTSKEAWQTALSIEEHFKTVFTNKAIVLEAEKVYHPYLLGDKKKKYIGRAFMDPSCAKAKIDCKGFQLKRTDATKLMKHVQEQIIHIMMPLDVNAKITVKSSKDNVINYIRQFCNDIVNDKFGVQFYELSKTARVTYKSKSFPEHMVVMHRHNKRIDEGLMQGEKYVSGSRPRYVILWHPNKKKMKVSDRVEDPDWIDLHPKKYKVDRVHYFDQIVTSVLPLIQFHVPESITLFDATRNMLIRSLSNFSNISHFFKSSKKRTNSDRLKELITKLKTSTIKVKKDPIKKKFKATNITSFFK